jgi:uncharacterized protein (DUF58 family)
VITLLFGFAAVNTGNNLVFLIVSALLAFMAVSGVIGWMNIRGITIRVDLPDEAYCGIETLVGVTAVNTRGRLPSFLLKVFVLGGTVDFDILNAGTEARSPLIYTFKERGEQAIPIVRLSSPFPINFFVRSRFIAADRRVKVFPEPRQCLTPHRAGESGKSGDHPDLHKGYEGDLIKIAEYTGGEPLKLVHWRISAKHEELKVKQLSSVSQNPIVLDIAAMPGRNMEENLSCAVYLINSLMRRGRPVGLRLKDNLFPPDITRGHRLRLLSELAIYGKN